MSKVAFQALQVPTPGYGTMSLSGAYGAADESESLQVLQRAFDLGCTFWDSASVYGFGGNERLIGRFLESHPEARDKLFIASKCGWPIENGQRGNLTNSASHIKQYIEDSTRRLGTAPDLYYLHRRDPNTPLAESIGALAELKQTGQCKYIGISEPSAATLREACKIAHIDAVQVEYSPWCTAPEDNGIIETARELGVTVVAFSPLGVGMLTGKLNDAAAVGGDIRGQSTRFQGDNFAKNRLLVEKLADIAKSKGCTPGQLALAWVAAQGAIPIPGTRRLNNLEENFGASKVSLTETELAEIRQVITGAAHGERWPAGVMSAMGQ